MPSKDLVKYDDSGNVVPSDASELPEYPADPRDGPHDVPQWVMDQIEPHLARAPLAREVRVNGSEPVSLRQVVDYAYKEARSPDALLGEVAQDNKIAPHQVDRPLPQGAVIELRAKTRHHDESAENERLKEWNKVHQERKKSGAHKHFIRVNQQGFEEEN